MTRARAALVLVPLLLAAAAAGCGSSPGPKKGDPVYAGMPRSAAREAATVESGSETTDGANQLYGHHLQLLPLTRGHDPTGEPAWQATFRDRTQDGQLLCIWMANGQYSGGVLLQPCPKARKGL
ncbi:MAG: hypothetical protein M3R39_02705 [Actinomycetota bacterium]|nr:hypothetical protein [Actinomycetota bacterium]